MPWQKFSLFNLGVDSPWGLPAGSLSTVLTELGSASGLSCVKDTATVGDSIKGANRLPLKFHGKEKKP